MTLGATNGPATDSSPSIGADVPASEHTEPGWTVIEPASGWVPLRLRDLWNYRELVYFLTWRDIKVRYKQTALGAAWAILQPVVTMIIFAIVFGHFAKFSSDGVPYPLFAYCGLLPWTFFAYAMTETAGSIVSNSSLVSKVYFPRLVIPLSASLAGLVDLVVASPVLVAMMLYYHVRPGPGLLYLPAFALLALLTVLALGLWLSALNVQYRDVRYAVPFLIQAWMYATPIAYPASMIRGRFHVLLALNPMSGVVEGLRWATLGTRVLDVPSILESTAIMLALLVGGLYYFRRMEQRFADVV